MRMESPPEEPLPGDGHNRCVEAEEIQPDDGRGRAGRYSWRRGLSHKFRRSRHRGIYSAGPFFAIGRIHRARAAGEWLLPLFRFGDKIQGAVRHR